MISSHHNELQSSIDFFKNENVALVCRRAQLQRLIQLLRALWAAEDESLYKALLKIEHSEPLTNEFFEEQAIAILLIEELESLDYRNNWNSEIESKVHVLAELIQHHIAGTESQFFKEVNSVLPYPTLVELGSDFQKKFDLEITKRKTGNGFNLQQ